MDQNTSFYRPRTKNFPLSISYFSSAGVKRTPLYIHSSNSLEFTFLLAGSVEIRVFEKATVLKPGDIHIIIPGENYTFRSLVPNTNYIYLSFSPDLISSTCPHFFQQQFVEPLKAGQLRIPRVIHPADAVYPKMHQQLSKLSAAKEGTEEYTCELYAVAISLCAALVPYCTIDGNPVLKSPASDIISVCLQYMRSHFSERITLQDLAEEVHLHPNYLCSLFKSVTGMTVFEHLNRFRINQASRILRSSDQPINQVAEQCGFRSASFFSRKFTEHYGMSPSIYQKFFSRQAYTELWDA